MIDVDYIRKLIASIREEAVYAEAGAKEPKASVLWASAMALIAKKFNGSADVMEQLLSDRTALLLYVRHKTMCAMNNPTDASTDCNCGLSKLINGE